MTAVALVLGVLAALGWLSFWCAEDKIADLTIELAKAHAAGDDLRTENRGLRRHLARTSPHPSSLAARARERDASFADTLAAIKALPETQVLYLNEDDETVEFRGLQ